MQVTEAKAINFVSFFGTFFFGKLSGGVSVKCVRTDRELTSRNVGLLRFAYNGAIGLQIDGIFFSRLLLL